MSNKLEYKIDKEHDHVKLREFLTHVKKLSGRLIKGAARDGRITVNSNVVKLNYILECDDIVEVDVDKEEDQNIEPQKMDIDVVYEDDDMVIVNKPANMVVHPTKSHPDGTLSNGLLYYFREKGEGCIVRLVSRLDMDTSGLIIIAKNQFSHMALSRNIKGKDFQKSYLAVVHGNMENSKGTIDLPIYWNKDKGIKRIVDDRGQQSITDYEVIERYSKGDLVKLTLRTGRTHQIRVHLSHLGYPIFGDALYGTGDDAEYISRQALHAYKLSFKHPRTGNMINIESQIPEDIMELINKIKNKNF